MVSKRCASCSNIAAAEEGTRKDFHARLDEIIGTGGARQFLAAKDAIADLGCETASVAILDNGDIDAWVIGNDKYDTDTLFQACSISKPITALAVMKLYDQGELDIDQSILAYLDLETVKSISTPDTKHLFQYVTIRQILSHTAGFSVHGFHGYLVPTEAPSSDTVLGGKRPSNTAQVRLEGLPGESYAYSGGGFVVLQRLLEVVTGHTFAELMRDLVLAPLGMNHSKFLNPSPGEHADAFFTGCTPCDVSFRGFPEHAAAGLWTTPSDLLKAIRSMQDDLTGRMSAFHLLGQQSAAEMLRVVKSDTALTWKTPEHSGRVFGHAGDSEPGWTCLAVGFADIKHFVNGEAPSPGVPDRSGICIMTNTSTGHRVYRKLFHAICFLKGWPSMSPLVTDGIAPLADLQATPNPTWRQWKGPWEGGWQLGEDDEGNPTLSIGTMPTLRLASAALALESDFERSQSTTFVCPGIVGVRLDLLVVGGERRIYHWREDGDGNPKKIEMAPLG